HDATSTVIATLPLHDALPIFAEHFLQLGKLCIKVIRWVVIEQAVDKGSWVIQVLRGRQQVWVIPYVVTLIDANSNSRAAPQLGGGFDLRGAKFNADNLGESLFCRSAGVTTVLPCACHRRGGWNARAQRFVAHVVNPAFNQSQQGFQAGDCRSIAGGNPWAKVHALQLADGILNGLWIPRFQVELAGGFF